MKKLLIVLSTVLNLQSFAQAPPKIRIPGKEDKQGVIHTGTLIERNRKYYSEDNRYYLQFQDDGNLVMYKKVNSTAVKPVWYSHTNGIAIQKAMLQPDGNLVLTDYAGKVRWDAWTDAKHKADRKKSWIDHFIVKGDTFNPVYSSTWMIVQTDGNLVIYQGDYPHPYTVTWASDSFENN